MMPFISTDCLAAVRLSIIFWAQLAVWPIEIIFDRIEDELEARGVSIE